MSNPRDIEALVTLEGVYAHVRRSTAAELAGQALGLSESAVRGMASRARHTPAGRVALLNYFANNAPKESPSVRRMRGIVQAGAGVWYDFNKALDTGATYTAVFASDLHFPAHDPAAMHLFYETVADLPNVAYVSTLNDAFDFPKLSVWQDRRRLPDQLFDADLSNAIHMHGVHMATLKDIAPHAVYVALTGNHDKRIFNAPAEGLIDYTALQFMEDLSGQGVTFIAPPDHENIIRINDGLLWFHGRNTSINRSTAAVKNYQTVKRETGYTRDFDLVYGHTHWSGEVPVPNTTGRVYNAGHLCARRQHYLRTAPDWQMGYVVSEFAPGGDWSYTQRVVFTPGRRGLALEATVNGKRYTVPHTG